MIVTYRGKKMTDIISNASRAILDKLGLIPEAVLAETLNLSTETLRDWRKPGHQHKLPWVQLGRRVFYRTDDVQKWVEASTVTPQPP